MINNNTNTFLGIKDEKIDLSTEFEKICDSNPKYIFAGTYNFSLPKNIWYKYSNLKCPKCIIFPFDYMTSNGPNIINKVSTIQMLINSGFAVLINSHNHSKFILSDEHCFIGSNNLSSNGIINNIENSIFMDSKSPDFSTWESEILKFINNENKGFASLKKVQSLERMISGIHAPIIEYKMSQFSLNSAMKQLETLSAALISVTDCYQHLGDLYINLAKKTGPTLVHLTNNAISISNYLLKDMHSQLSYKKHHETIFIRGHARINNSISTLQNELNSLSAYRLSLYNDYFDTWKTPQEIYEQIDCKYVQMNLNNLSTLTNCLKGI